MERKLVVMLAADLIGYSAPAATNSKTLYGKAARAATLKSDSEKTVSSIT